MPVRASRAFAVAKALVNVGGHAEVVTNLVTEDPPAWIMDGVWFKLTKINETEFRLLGSSQDSFEQFKVVKDVISKVKELTWWPETEDPDMGLRVELPRVF